MPPYQTYSVRPIDEGLIKQVRVLLSSPAARPSSCLFGSELLYIHSPQFANLNAQNYSSFLPIFPFLNLKAFWRDSQFSRYRHVIQFEI